MRFQNFIFKQSMKYLMNYSLFKIIHTSAYFNIHKILSFIQRLMNSLEIKLVEN